MSERIAKNKRTAPPEVTVDYHITNERRGDLRRIELAYLHHTVDWWASGDDDEIARKVSKLQARLNDRDKPKFQVNEDVV